MTTSNSSSNNNCSAVHPLDEQQYTTTTSFSHTTISFSSAIEFTTTMNNTPPTTTITPPPQGMGHQQRAYSVTSMPSELQKRQETELQQQQKEEKIKQPWWQYYYQLYHYHLPPGRKPTVFGPYLLLQTLGEGEFGKVKFGIEVKTGQEVAIKLIRKDSIDSSSRMTKVEREISVLRILHHPNIVELFDVIETEKYIGIILQCATGGELFDYILAHRHLKERDASRLFAQLMSGVHYMHQKQIVHRDLKLENLLLDRHRNVLITDFGFANQFISPQDDLMSTSCGSPCYAAPELVMNQGVYVGPAVDIWSCGVILFAMLCGYLPYDDDPANPESYNINLLYKYILNTPLIFPDYISDEACDLLSLMLVPDPEKRCTMDQIMNHPWLAPHKHLFAVADTVNREEEEEEEEDLIMEEDEEPTPEPTRRNTIANIHTNSHQDQVVPRSSITVSAEKIVEEEEQQQQDQVIQDTSAVIVTEQQQETAQEKDVTMQEITSIELPPPTVMEDETTDHTKKDDTLMTEKETVPPSEKPTLSTETASMMTTTKEQESNKEEALHTVSPLPTLTNSTKTTNSKKVRPKSTLSTSSTTEKVLHFLSGHSNTPKPNNFVSGVARNTRNANTSINEKRARHMSLATTVPTTTLNNVVPPSPTTTTSTSSILHSKFLSSIQRNKTPHLQEVPKLAAPTPTATSASTPHPSTNNKRHVRLSNTVKPTPTQQQPEQQQQQRGTRRKTLSLLVNSMTDNKPFSHRRQSTLKSPIVPSNTPSPPPPSTPPASTATETRKINTPKMTPSASEHTINSQALPMDSKEKHRSAGKKLMDWFKKKPLSTINQNNIITTNNNRSSSNILQQHQVEENDLKLRIHHGAVDQEALTSRPPAQVFLEVKQTLKALGLEFKRDGGEYKLKCVRPKKPLVVSTSSSSSSTTLPMALQSSHPIQSNGGTQTTTTPFRMLLRRSSAVTSTTPNVSSSSSSSGEVTKKTTTMPPPTIYGDPNVDPGEEVRFSIEVCKIKNLPGLYIVDMRRMRGNVWAYKYIYRTLLDTLNLGGKSGYLNKKSSPNKQVLMTDDTTVATTAAATTTLESGLTSTNSSHHRMSMASEELDVIEEDQVLPPTPLTKEIAV